LTLCFRAFDRVTIVVSPGTGTGTAVGIPTFCINGELEDEAGEGRPCVCRRYGWDALRVRVVDRTGPIGCDGPGAGVGAGVKPGDADWGCARPMS
jgi:hypothetical protein